MPTTILRPYLHTLKNRVFPPNRSERQVKTVVMFGVVAAIIMVCIFIGFSLILASSMSNPFFRSLIPTKIIELLFYVFFFLMLISNTIASVGNIYTADNMNLLMVTPVSSFRLYLAKLAETMFETGLMFVIFVSPAALAYCHILGLGTQFFVYGVLVAIPFLFIPAGASVVLATVFVRFASIVWRRGMFFILCLIGVAVWGISNFLTILEQVRLERGGTNAIVQMIGLFDNPSPIWMPSRWAADVLSSLVDGTDDPLFRTHFLLLATTAFGAVAVGFLTFDLFLVKVRSASGVNHRMRTRFGTASGDFVRRGLEISYSLMPLDVQRRAVILKDLTSLVRDRAQALQLLLYLGISTVYVIIFRFMGGAMNFSPTAYASWLAFLACTNILFAGFILTALMTRLVYPSVSLEGRAFWILQITPVGIDRLVSAKFWCWFPVSLVLALSLLVAGATAIGATPETVICTAIIGIAFSVGCTGLATGLGAMFASFTWESPNQISAGFGTLVLLLSSLAHVVVLSIPASVLTFLVAVPELRTKIGTTQALAIMTLCLFTILLTNILLARWTCRRGIRSLTAQVTK